MSRTTAATRNLGLALIVIVVIGGLIGASSVNLQITTLGAVLIVVALLEAVLILAGFSMLKRRRLSSSEAPGSLNSEG